MKRLFFISILWIVLVEILAWLGLLMLGGLMPETEIIPRTAHVFSEQTRQVRSLLDSLGTGRHNIDPVLGWTYRSGTLSPIDRISRQGLRSDRTYSQLADPGITRIAAYGDSFTYASEVSNAEAWAAQIEQMNPQLQVLNYGVPGFGTDQSYLRYLREGKELSPSVVIIGFAPVDLGRSVNVYRRFLSTRELPFGKPRFVLDEENALIVLPPPLQNSRDYERLIDNPQLVKQFGKNDYWYSPVIYENPAYDWSATVRLISNIWLQLDRRLFNSNRLLVGGEFNPDSEAFHVQTALLKQFYDEVRRAGQIPLIVIFPGHVDVQQNAIGDTNSYGPLIDYLEQHDLMFLDCADIFLNSGDNEEIDRLFAPGGHYSPEGNQLIAEFIATHLLTSEGSP